MSLLQVRERSMLQKPFLLKSPWVELWGRRARYLCDRPIHAADPLLGWGLEIEDLVTLIWQPEERRVEYIRGKHFTSQKLRYWVLHAFLPLVFELEGRWRMLHAGAVSVGGSALVFTAPSYGGKSTLTGYFLKRGHRLFSDDALAIEKRDSTYYAIPSYPFHRPYRKVESLGEQAGNFASGPAEIRALYRLERINTGTDIEIEALQGIGKFKALYESAFVDFDFLKRERFAYFSDMARALPVYRLAVPWDRNRLPEVHEAVTAHFEGIEKR
ncbi:hypothetical protein [Nitratifractor salsuginis]|nr:hypothetical protein [Nitratifractor salsuginis]